MVLVDEDKHYHHGDLRNALIVAGLEMVTESGFSQLDLRKVGRKVGVSHAAVYRHFEDKESLLAAICIEGFIQLNTLLQNVVIPHHAELETRLYKFIDVYVGYSLKNSALVREMLSGLFISYQRFPAMIDVMGVAPKLLEQLIAPYKPKYAITLMYGINGFTLQQLKTTSWNTEAIEHDAKQLVQLFCYGIKSSI